MPYASRRDFLKKMAAGAAGTLAARPASRYGRILGANDRITMGFVGIGGMASYHLSNALKQPDVQVAALCDVYEPHLEEAASKVPDADTYTDFRRVLDRGDIDAVLIGTPDHWHALVTMRACEAGKDVYVEKPNSRTIREGRLMVESARRHDRVVQAGTQQRSAPVYQKAVDLIHRGELGPITSVRTWNVSNAYPNGIGSPEDEAPPPELDWDMWLGPAPEVPFNPNRFDDWRRFWDYAGGRMTDWGVHHLDIVQWALQEDYPQAAAAVGGRFCLQDNRETPDTLTATFQYPDCVCTYESRHGNGHALHGRDYGIAFYGMDGTLVVDRSRLEVIPEPGSSVSAVEHEGEPGKEHVRHLRNFLDCIKSREKPNSDIASGHRSTTTAILGNMAFRSERRVAWDGRREQVSGVSSDSEYLSVDYHGPWSIRR